MREISVALITLVTLILFQSIFPSLGYESSNSNAKCEHADLDIAIVGAGIGGAYSAYKLRNRGLNIGVFEYSDRIGGRLFTRSLPNVPDLNLELGGMRYLKGRHTLLQSLIADLKLTPKIFLEGFEDVYEERVFKRNTSMTATEFSTGDVPYNLTREEKANQADLVRHYFTTLTNDTLEGLTEERLFNLTVPDGRKLYTLSVPEALSLVASPEGLRYVLDQSHFNSKHIAATDMCFYLFGTLAEANPGAEVLTVEEGMSAIPKRALESFLAASANNSLNMNHKLESVKTISKTMFRLKFRKTITEDEHTGTLPHKNATKFVCAKKVILAMPKYALSRLRQRAIRSRYYRKLLRGTFVVHASKVFLTYAKQWWMEDAKYPARIVLVGGLGEIYDFGTSNVTGDHALIVSYNDLVGAAEQYVTNHAIDRDYLTDNIGGWDDPDEPYPVILEPWDAPGIPGSVEGENKVTAPLKDYLYDRLAPAFGISRSSIPEPLTAVARFWIRYPFGGGWSFVRPGYTYDQLVSGFRRPSPLEDLFVVGTDFSVRDTFGWCEGALNTAESVLEEFFPSN